MIPTREVIVRSIRLVKFPLILYQFITNKGIEQPIFIDIPSICSGQQRVQLRDWISIVINLSITICMSITPRIRIISRIRVHTQLILDIQFVIIGIELRRIFQISISKETLWTFQELVVIYRPISSVKTWCATECILCIRVTLNMTWDTG